MGPIVEVLDGMRSRKRIRLGVFLQKARIETRMPVELNMLQSSSHIGEVCKSLLCSFLIASLALLTGKTLAVLLKYISDVPCRRHCETNSQRLNARMARRALLRE